MELKIIRTKKDYQQAMERFEKIFQARSGTKESEEADVLLGNQKATAEYSGYSACPIPTEYGKLMLAEFDYSNTPKMTFPFDQVKPRWSMWMLKTKILPWLYWNKILKGTA